MATEPVVEGGDLEQITTPIGSFQFIKSWINAPLWRTMRQNEAQEVSLLCHWKQDWQSTEEHARTLLMD